MKIKHDFSIEELKIKKEEVKTTVKPVTILSSLVIAGYIGYKLTKEKN